MNTTRMPGFSAEASFYRSSAHYQVGPMLASLRQEGEVLVHPAVRWVCGMKTCCLIFGPGVFRCFEKE
jgi:hypothetical protein